MTQAPRPIERTSFRFLFFVSSMALLGAAAWAFWDEAVARRPWKEYQREFNQLEYDRVNAEYERARAEFESPRVQKEYDDLKNLLRAAEENLKGQAYREAEQRFEALKRELADVSQKWQFVKSELEEAYYWYELALKENRNVEARKAEVGRLRAREEELRGKAEGLERQVEEAKKEVRRYSETVAGVKAKLDKLQAPLAALKRQLDAIKDRPLEIKQVVLNGLDMNEFREPILRVDRCQTCHLGIDRPGFEDAKQPFRTHPHREVIFAAHPVSRFGCTICHQGQGPALDYVKLVDGRIPDGPHGLGKEHGGDPHLLWDFPLLRGELVQASCRRCHVEQDEVHLAPAYMQGKALFETLGCFGCHSVKGYEKAEKVGPDLTRVRSKVNPSWLVRWIMNPKDYLPRTKMPNFSLSQDEATSIAAYLLSSSEPELPPLARHTGGDQKKGKELVGKLGCLGCHRVGNEFPAPPQPKPEEMSPAEAILARFDPAPDLGQVGSKVNADWLFRWLKDPKRFSPKTRMPNLRLSDKEAADITAYLMTLGSRRELSSLRQELQKPERVKAGEQLIAKRGCFGCHDIRGFEKAERIAPELSNFGRKRLLELFFGHAFHVRETWEDWTFHKLKDPQIYQTDVVVQLMPNFGFSDEEVKVLRVWLKSLVTEEPSKEYQRVLSDQDRSLQEGRRLVKKYNCVGCHVIEGKGGKVAAYYEPKTMAPPPLEAGELHEGEKVQAPWLFEFLKQPFPLRPWLEVRMPTFGLSDEEATGLARYFATLGKQRFPYEFADFGKIPEEQLKAAEALMSKAYLDCGSCHPQGDKKPEGPREGWGPDLAMAKRRLRPDWIVRWLRDPQKIQPDTKMPSFFLGPDAGPEDILGGDEERQILAIRDYLMNRGR